eukprot:1436363-Pyramimonas_sp.AAC.1
MLFVQVLMNLSMLADITDVKNAFCQSDPVTRSQGDIYVEPCEGIELQKGRRPSCMDDAPVAWRRTAIKFLQQH